jgi:hypothetical protein
MVTEHTLFASTQSSSPEKPDPGPRPDVTPPKTPTPGTPEPGDPPGKGPGDPPPSKPKPASPAPVEPKSATGLVDPRDLTGENEPISLPEEPTVETPDADDSDDSSHDVKPIVQGMVDPRL